MKNTEKRFTINCLVSSGVIETGDFMLENRHVDTDPENTYRLFVNREGLTIELLPTKGFSLGQVHINDKQIFWNQPNKLPDPVSFSPYNDIVYINKNAVRGFSYIPTYMGGVELYGMRNWGMPRIDKGFYHPVHGETSNIPVKETEVHLKQDGSLELTASFIYRDMYEDRPEWHTYGKEMFRITRTLTIPPLKNELSLVDSITNCSEEVLVPDWGYHITFRAEEDAKLLVNAGKVLERFGNKLHDKYDHWEKSPYPDKRIETGIICQELKTVHTDENGREYAECKAVYPDKSEVSLRFPQSPYFQLWMSRGNPTEFTFKDGSPVFKRNWDGMGIELGSSSLDHTDNTDKTVNYKESLKPGETLTIPFQFRF